MSDHPAFYQTYCPDCRELIAVHDRTAAVTCPGCGSEHKVPPRLGAHPEYTLIEPDWLEFDPETLQGLEELTRDLEELDREYESEATGERVEIATDSLVSVSRLLQTLSDIPGLNAEDTSALITLAQLDQPHEVPVLLPGVGPEQHRLMTVGQTTYLLVLGTQPAVLFAGSFSAAKGLDIILEVFELFIMVAFGVKPGLKAIGKAFKGLVDKIANSRVYQALIRRLVEAIKSRRVKKILERLKEFIDRVFRDNYDELVTGLKDALVAYFRFITLLLALIRWLARAVTGGSSVGLEIAAWVIGFLIKLRNNS